jgi:hypothetical protein
VVVYWGSNYASAFNVLGSTDGVNFTILYSVSGNTSVENVITLSGVTYQYVMMKGVSRSNTGAGYVIDEMEVYGQLTNLCLTPVNLNADSITQNSATLTWQADSGATSYNVQYKTSLVSNWITTTTTADSVSIAALSCNSGYTFEVQAVCPIGNSAEAAGTFTTGVCSANCGPLPTRYFNADLGNVGVAGSSCLNNGVYTIQGSGTDIGGTSDEFQYAFTNLAGDETVYAAVLTQDSTNPNNKAGLMFRDSVSSTSPFAFIGITSGGTAVFEYRTVSGGPTTNVTITGITAPYWVELVKTGTTYAAYISPTGLPNSWVQVGTGVNLGFGNAGAYIGMAVTSDNNAVLSTATFDNFTIVNSPSIPQLLSFTATNYNNQYVITSWSTSAGFNATYFNVQRSVDSVHFGNFAQVNAADTGTIQNYTADDLHPVTGHDFYRLQIISADSPVAYSQIVPVDFGYQTVPQLYPNPAISYFVVVAAHDPIKGISVIDVAGRIVQRIINTNGSSVITVNSDGLAAGVYIIEMETATAIYKQKLVKQ